MNRNLTNETKSGLNTNQVRKNQPSMGLKAYTLKSKKVNEQGPGDVEMEVPKSCVDIPKKRERLFKNKSMMLREELQNINNNNDDVCNQNSIFKSDSNLIRDLKTEDIYECLNNYESNQIYFQLSDDTRTKLEQEQDQMSIRSAETLVPFLDFTKGNFIHPLLSSTSRSSLDQDSDFSMEKQYNQKITPLKSVSVVTRSKKMRPLSQNDCSPFGSVKQERFNFDDDKFSTDV